LKILIALLVLIPSLVLAQNPPLTPNPKESKTSPAPIPSSGSVPGPGPGSGLMPMPGFVRNIDPRFSKPVERGIAVCESSGVVDNSNVQLNCEENYKDNSFKATLTDFHKIDFRLVQIVPYKNKFYYYFEKRW
jgi:hypothetical protein